MARLPPGTESQPGEGPHVISHPDPLSHRGGPQTHARSHCKGGDAQGTGSQALGPNLDVFPVCQAPVPSQEVTRLVTLPWASPGEPSLQQPGASPGSLEGVSLPPPCTHSSPLGLCSFHPSSQDKSIPPLILK